MAWKAPPRPHSSYFRCKLGDGVEAGAMEGHHFCGDEQFEGCRAGCMYFHLEISEDVTERDLTARKATEKRRLANKIFEIFAKVK